MISYELAAQMSNMFAALCGVVFVAIYSFYAPWRKSKLGRHVMTMCFTITVLALYSFAIRFFPESMEENLKIVRAAGVAFVGLLLLQRARLVYIAQKRRRNNGNAPVG